MNAGSTYITIAIITIGFILILAMAPGNGHEFPGEMAHIEGEKKIENVFAVSQCYAGETKQNKIVFYQDFDRDGVIDTCVTVWQEHGKLHGIISKPREDGVCECQGYVWLDGDE